MASQEEYLITWISLVAGGQMAFWLARRFGRGFAEKWISQPVLDRWDKSAAGSGIGFLQLPWFCLSSQTMPCATWQGWDVYLVNGF